jgi:hypothetical protein
MHLHANSLIRLRAPTWPTSPHVGYSTVRAPLLSPDNIELVRLGFMSGHGFPYMHVYTNNIPTTRENMLALERTLTHPSRTRARTRTHVHAEHAGGHNGLCAAAYLARGGRSVCVLERRHVLGGAAVTEEIIPGFKFSRVSE